MVLSLNRYSGKIMKLSTTFSAIMLAVSINSSSYAEDTVHTYGIQTAVGGLEYKGKSSDSEAVGHGYIYYNFQFMPHYSFELGLLGGSDINDWHCNKNGYGEFECYADKNDMFEFNADHFDYSAAVLAIKTDLTLSKRNSLYAKAGAEFYEYSFELDRHKIIDNDGVGLFVEAGWEYRWDNGIGMNASIQHHHMGDVKMSALNVGISYAF